MARDPMARRFEGDRRPAEVAMARPVDVSASDKARIVAQARSIQAQNSQRNRDLADAGEPIPLGGLNANRVSRIAGDLGVHQHDHGAGRPAEMAKSDPPAPSGKVFNRRGEPVTVTVPPSACRDCGGDGCARCNHTGYAPTTPQQHERRDPMGRRYQAIPGAPDVQDPPGIVTIERVWMRPEGDLDA